MNLLRSELLSAVGFVHAFSSRDGGVSQGCFGSLNLGRGVGDSPAAVAENHRRLALAVGYAPASLYEVEQIHGRRCVLVADEAGDAPQRADAIVALPGQSPIAVRTADCVPILLADVRRGCVAAVHAGWRGAVAGVLPAAFGELLRERTQASVTLEAGRVCDVRVAIGPHIRRDAFEVGEEVAAQVQAVAPAAPLVDRRRARLRADLAGLVRAQLEQLGVSPASIDDVGGCTHSEPERFFSHRRDEGRSGRHLAVILPRVE